MHLSTSPQAEFDCPTDTKVRMRISREGGRGCPVLYVFNHAGRVISLEEPMLEHLVEWVDITLPASPTPYVLVPWVVNAARDKITVRMSLLYVCVIAAICTLLPPPEVLFLN